MRRRIVLAIMLVAGASVALFALPLALAVRDNYRDEELLRLQRDAVVLSRGIDVQDAGSDPIELPQTGDAIAVYDRAGRRVAGDGPATADALVTTTLRTLRPDQRAGGGALVATVPLVVAERVTGVVRIARDGSAITRRTRQAWLGLAGLAAVVLVLAAAAAVAIARRLAGPLERIAAGARRLGHGDFTARAAPSGVAELDAVGHALDVTAQRLDDLISRERAFSADASHQLRTPLTALRIELEAIELRPDPPPELASALTQVERLQTTMDTLLAAARDAPRTRTTFSLGTIVDEVAQRWREPLAASDRRLHVVMEAPDAGATGSPAVLTEILSVLMSNATQHGRGTVTVTVRHAAPGWVALDVADEGPGVAGSPEAIFARRVGSGEGGHGIGLALARTLATAEGARLSLGGAGPHPVFTLLLPEATTDDGFHEAR